jgi:hypothetical protein
VLVLADFELLGDVLTDHGGWALDLELDLLEPLDLVSVQHPGQLAFGFVLKLLHRLAHQLPALGLGGVASLLSLELGSLLLLVGVDLGLAGKDPRLVAAIVQGSGQGIAGSRAAGIDVGIDLRTLLRLALGFLCCLGLGQVGLLANLLHHIAPLVALVVGDALDHGLLAVGQLELFLDGVVAGEHDQVATGASGATPSARSSRPAARSPSALPATARTAGTPRRRLCLGVDGHGRHCNNQGRDESDSDA